MAPRVVGIRRRRGKQPDISLWDARQRVWFVLETKTAFNAAVGLVPGLGETRGTMVKRLKETALRMFGSNAAVLMRTHTPLKACGL